MAITQRKRSEIGDEFKWRTDHLYATDDAWQKDFDCVADGMEGFAAFKGNLNRSAQTLLDCLTLRDKLGKILDSVYVYAHMRLHEDSGNSLYQGLADKSETVLVKFSSALSFVEPEILAIDAKVLEGFITERPELKLYAHYFEDLLREKAHILSPEMEELLANARELAQAPDSIYSMMTDADMRFGTIRDENGDEVEITQGRFISLLESKDREVRKNAYGTFYDSFIKQKNAMAAAFNASVKGDIFFSRARKYPSALEKALSGNNIPREVYASLIDTVHEYLPELHRYVRLRKKRLGLEKLHMYDLYTPIVPDADTKVDYKTAAETVLQGLSPLGEDYVEIVREGFQNGWVDVYENEGKRSGAYSWGANGCHPYILLNYDGKINDMFTVAHEMGHALHSHYSWGHQPYVYSDYSIFLAEVASTVNEALLMEHLIKTTADPHTRAYLLNYFLEQFKGTVFRQTMFAEFEMIVHDMVEKGEPLTVESLCRVYGELNQSYYGPDIVADEIIAYEWARIPHFYSAFYVYQYATGYSAAISLSRRILEKGEEAVLAYKGFLKAGSSDYSIEILKKAGVDMSGPQPVRDALNKFKELLDEMEGL